jgi:hypothetical protein
MNFSIREISKLDNIFECNNNDQCLCFFKTCLYWQQVYKQPALWNSIPEKHHTTQTRMILEWIELNLLIDIP